MKRVIGITLLLLMAAFATSVLACPTSVICPIHNIDAYYTGTRIVDGVVVGVYHCPRFHDFIGSCK
jgi:hypothetical protein